MLTSFPLPLAIPPLRNSWGVHEPVALRSIVRLTTDDGCVGWGETYGGEDILRKLQGAASLVKGLDPALFNRLRILINNPPVFAAYETAMLDLLGKAGGRPVCDVLGGKVRDTVPYSAYLFYKYAGDDEWGEAMSPEQLVAQAETFVDRYGFETLKLKGGVLPPEAEAETMRQLRERFPQHQLRIDPNAIWSVETSIRFAGWVEDLDMEYYEDPAPDLAGMAAVAQATPIPLATNMVVTAFTHIAPSVQMDAVQVVLADHHHWGGMQASLTLAKICETFRLGISQHSNSHTGISLAAMTHWAAAAPNLIYASDTHYPWNEEDDIVQGAPLQFVDGAFPVPTDRAWAWRLTRSGCRRRTSATYRTKPRAGTMSPPCRSEIRAGCQCGRGGKEILSYKRRLMAARSCPASQYFTRGNCRELIS